MEQQPQVAPSSGPTYLRSRSRAELGVLVGDGGLALAALGVLATPLTGFVFSPFLWGSYLGWGAAAWGYALLSRHLFRCGEPREAVAYATDAAAFASVALAGACLAFAPHLSVVLHVLASVLILAGLCVPEGPAEHRR